MASIPTAGAVPESTGHLWSFGACEVDERKRELKVQSVEVNLESKPWEVLHQLLLHAGEVVTKEELLEAVWPGTNVVDGSLATAVSKLRKALGDESMIVTVPRIGYRLAVPVQITPTAPFISRELHFTPGQRVPRREQWFLVRRLGRSPSSEVWLAEHPKTHETRVFKFAADEERLKGLKREVTLARLLRTSLGERCDFVRVLEWNFDEAPYFLESEFAGLSLNEWAEQQGGLKAIPLQRRLQLLIRVAAAVAAAHSLDVLHKDLKPGNILVSNSSSDDNEIKVADFGSAALLSPGRLGALRITNLGFTQGTNGDNESLTGTVIYIAPEVLSGQSPTATSDVYALGVLLYQMVTGDFRKPLAPGWEAEVDDPLIRKDIEEAACGDPARRMKTAAQLAERLSNLESRRRDLEQLEATREFQMKRRRYLRVVIPIAIVLLVLIATFKFQNSRSSVTAPKLKTVAILPFRNVSADPSVEYLRLALSDEVATTLGHIRGLVVRPSSTTSKYTAPDVDLKTAGKQMGAATIVTGHFIKQGQQLHITLEAIDVETNSVVWRDQIDAMAPSMIAMQVQIALRVKGGLAPALGAAANDVGTQPKNEEAYELYLRSIAVPLQQITNKDGIVMLERAVALDPGYAPAWLALARRYYAESHYTGQNRGEMELYSATVKKALAIDPDYVGAWAALVLGQVERGDLVEAYKAAQDLVRRRPDNADAHFVLSYVLRYGGLLDEAAPECDKALLIDGQTQNSGVRSCAVVFLLRQDYPGALNYINVDPDSDLAKSLKLEMFVRQGKREEALQQIASYSPKWGGFDLLVAKLQQKSPDEIHRMAEAVKADEDPETNYFAAAHLAYVGETRAALEILRAAIKGNYCSYPSMDMDPFFATIRTQPEFAEIRNAGMQCQNNFLAQRDRR
ncbi:MAG TPA: winged helix-turn-helix domain-containing protein [Pyrinomonadaceae bacterium]|nr:winged helix-turn-helix domain-containing protein [Pyrinomonadaceae bacterium]